MRKRLGLLTLIAAILPAGPLQAARFEVDPVVNDEVTRTFEIPLFHLIPTRAFAKLPEEIPTTDRLLQYVHPEDSAADPKLGLRMYYTSRENLSERLAKTGFVQTGDVLLSFRPEWGGASSYTNVQMGISHAGMAFVYMGSVYNLDNPLNAEYLGKLNSSHYLETKMLHIIRPRNLTSAQQRNLRHWALKLTSQARKIYPSQISFNGNYFAPKYVRGQPLEFVKKLGAIALGLNTSTDPLSMFCSELVWSTLALRNCSPEVMEPFSEAQASVPECVSPIFEPTPALAGDGNPALATGPLLVIRSLEKSAEEERKLLDQVFEPTKSMTKLSPGHRQVAQSMNDHFSRLQDYYRAVMEGAPAGDVIREGFNRAIPPNYSPTTFLVNSMLPVESSARAFDYVGTIVFTD